VRICCGDFHEFLSFFWSRINAFGGAVSYKFRPINKWLLESLACSTIYIPSFEQLNDPFDCQLDIDFLFKNAADLASQRGDVFIERILKDVDFKEGWKREVLDIGVYSVSFFESEVDSILYQRLMWSHYADRHTGLCIKYSDKFTQHVILRAQSSGAVNYLDRQNSEEVIVNKICDLPREQEAFSIGLRDIFLFTKESSWRYEKEGRFVVDKKGAWELPEGCIEAVYFGVNTSKNDVDLVMKLARLYSGCNKFFKAKKSGVFDLCFEDMSE
jgi:hypothetical protein